MADAISAITFLKRVMAAPNDNQVSVAQLLLVGNDPTPGADRARLGLFAKWLTEMAASDFGPILKAVALADQAFKYLWANTAHATPAESNPTEEQGLFWAGVAEAYTGYLPPGYEQDI